jgi:triacylglycerol esterase/lipase EstA (alpha/beta hydrolase family)
MSTTRARGRWTARHSYASVARELGGLAAGGLLPRRSLVAHPCALLPLRSSASAARRPPVVLVPGYGGNGRTGRDWRRALSEAGFDDLHVLAYDPTTSDIPALAAGLSATCRAALRTARTSQVHLVGHSLGGVLIRYAVARLGLADSVRTAVTVASPHHGTPVARLSPRRRGGRAPARIGAAARAERPAARRRAVADLPQRPGPRSSLPRPRGSTSRGSTC